ncbi:hypothetical protein BGZ52_004182, partial [Haplosporangium bisporale]
AGFNLQRGFNAQGDNAPAQPNDIPVRRVPPHNFAPQERRPRPFDTQARGTFRAPEDLLEDEDEAEGSPIRHFNPWDTSSSMGSTSGNNVTDWWASLDDDNSGEGSSSSARLQDDNQIRTKSGTLYYWKAGIPLTYDNMFMNLDGSEMSLEQKIARFDELASGGDLSQNDWNRLLRWRAEELHNQITENHADPNLPQAEQQRRLGQLRQGREMLLQQMQRNDLRNYYIDHDRDPLGQVEQPIRPVQPQRPPQPHIPAAPAPIEEQPQQPQQPQQPLVDPMDDAQVDDGGEINLLEMAGLLEVIGMRGSYWTLLQNSILMSILISGSLAVGVLVPFLVGKTAVLMNPFNILRIPLKALGVVGHLMDPILDFILDRVLPFFGSVVMKPCSLIAGIVSPLAGSYLGGKPIESLVHNHVMPAWRAVFDTSTSSISEPLPQEAQEAAKVVVEGAFKSALSQISLKLGSVPITPPDEKTVAIAVGYLIFFVIATTHYKSLRHARRDSFGGLIRDVLLQLGLIQKIAFFVAIEMIVFPLFCGVVIGMTTLPLFEGATFMSRIAFYLQSPNWSAVMHWLVGTAFMFNFSMFVSTCRTVVRSGVMWFIRDPNDEGFQPVREILERPIWMQLRKLGSGALMYLTLIVIGISVNTHAVNLLWSGVLPLRRPLAEPLSDFPIDLVFFHVVMPMTLKWLNLLDGVFELFKFWWRLLSKMLRLSSFMFGLEGERYPEEEGHFEYRTWKAWLLRYRYHGDDAVFVKDGGLYRVPDNDRIVHLKNRRVLVPVDDQGHALDPKEDMPGEIDPLMELLPRRRDVPQQPIDPKEGTIIVYAPPNFKRRLILFILLIWSSSTSFLAIAVVSSLLLGRQLISLLTKKHVHDTYSLVIGIYAMAFLVHISKWLFENVVMQDKELAKIRIEQQLKKTPSVAMLIVKALYFGVTFGVIVPFTLGLMVDISVIQPVCIMLEGSTGVYPALDWAIGLIYMRIAMAILKKFPANPYTVIMNFAFPDSEIANWNVKLYTRNIFLPIMSLSICAFIAPSTLARLAVNVFALEGSAREAVFKFSYPAVLLSCLLALCMKETVTLLTNWSIHVRNKVYQRGLQLQNLSEVEATETPISADGATSTTTTTTTETPAETETTPGPNGAASSSSTPTASHVPLSRSNTRWVRKEREVDLEVDPDMPVLEDVSEDEGVSSFRRSFISRGKSVSRDNPLEDEEMNQEEGEGIAGRTRLRRSRRLQSYRDGQE